MTTLTQRYVAVAVAGVPEPARDDVVAELQATIADAVDALRAGGLTGEEAERQALIDLGDPAELAEQYGGRPRHLIGSDYYPAYSQLLRTLLLVVTPIVGVATLLAQGATGSSIIDVSLSAIGTMFQVGVQIAFWVTAVFAFLERSHTPVPRTQWSPERLPEVVDRRIGLGETVTGIALLTILMWAIIWQRDHWLVTVDGVEVSALNAAVWAPWFVTLLGVLLASIILEIVKYRAGRWTIGLATVNTVLNAIVAGIVLWLANSGTLLTPGVADLLPAAVVSLMPWLVVAIAAFDTVEGWWYAVRGVSPATSGIAQPSGPLH